MAVGLIRIRYSSKMFSLKNNRFIFVALLLLWMAVIFIMSSHPSEKSSQVSGGLVSKIVDVLYPGFNNLSLTQQSDITHSITFVVRKTAHFSEYFILGLLGFLLANTYTRYKFSLRVLFISVCCVVYAVSDEVHQYFVPGRACRFVDILIDSAGIFAATFILSAIHRKNIKRKDESFAEKEIN